MAWDTSCLDWEARLLSGQSLVPDLPLFPEQAAKALRIFDRLRVPDLIGKPRMSEAAGPWLRPIVSAIFGSLDPVTQRRMIQEFFWLIPKKNGKTSTAAAIMVEALILNERPEGEFILVAPTKDVADRAFKQAAGTIRADPNLETLFHHQQHIRTITHRVTGAQLQVKAADTDVITGGKQVGTLVDELHVLAGKPNADEILLELRGALTARPDGFLIFITTQSKKPPVGVMKSELQKARDVRDGKQRQPLLPILYELPQDLAKDGGWKNRRFWPLVNPNLGRSVDLEFLERQVEAAESEGPAQMALIASQHFNVEIGLGLRTDSWVGAEDWPECVDDKLTLDALLARCDVITASIDGGGRDDLLGLCLLGRERDTGRWLAWFRAWAHRIALERRKSEMSRLLDFERDGDLVVVDEVGTHVAQAVDIVERVFEAGLLGGVGLDSYDIKDIVAELSSRGISGEGVFGDQSADLVQGIPQGWKISGAIKTTELKLAARKLIHAGRPLMSWCVGNAKVEPKGNAISITKAAAGTAKIDPLVALFNAVELMTRDPKPAGGSVYDERGIVLI
jgi:phage terminase large subunit-like protein